MLTKDSVRDLTRRLTEENPNTLIGPDSYLKHSCWVYDLAEKVIKNILSQYPNIPLNPEEVASAAGLHDIGRTLKQDQIFHELRGANYIEQNGVEKGIALSQRDARRMAQMIRPHGFVYESWQDTECEDTRKEFEPLESDLLIPNTWQESIVAYSDLASLEGERVEVEERLRELLQRYANNPNYKKGAIIVRAVTNAQTRIMALAERVEALEQGKLTEQDIARYGFL